MMKKKKSHINSALNKKSMNIVA